jgi:hypothetical protein
LAKPMSQEKTATWNRSASGLPGQASAVSEGVADQRERVPVSRPSQSRSATPVHPSVDLPHPRLAPHRRQRSRGQGHASRPGTVPARCVVSFRLTAEHPPPTQTAARHPCRLIPSRCGRTPIAMSIGPAGRTGVPPSNRASLCAWLRRLGCSLPRAARIAACGVGDGEGLCRRAGRYRRTRPTQMRVWPVRPDAKARKHYAGTSLITRASSTAPSSSPATRATADLATLYSNGRSAH